MGDTESRSKPYDDAVTNIRDTAKWMTASLGAVFAIMMGGFQLRSAGFADPAGVPGLKWWSLIGVVALLVTAIWAATSVLVHGGTSWKHLLEDKRLGGVRKYINRNWSANGTDVLSKLAKDYAELSDRVRGNTLSNDDPVYLAKQRNVLEALSVAKWRTTLFRFNVLRIAYLFLVPVAVVSSIFIAGKPEISTSDAKTLDPPIVLQIPTRGLKEMLVDTKQWPSSCIGQPAAVLLYTQSNAGVGEAVTIPTKACPMLHVLILDRKTILKVL